ncbi:MAG: hypothetical protein Fur006_57220 [Coleofasciculaceae cyanobacterium]
MPIHTLHRLVARVADKSSLRTVLIVPFVLQIVGTVGLVGYLSFKSGQESVEDLAQQLMGQVGERVSDRITTYLHAPQTAVAANHLAVEQGILNINDFEQLRQQLWQQLTLNPSLEALYFSNEPGEEIGYGRFQSEETVKQAEKLAGEDLSMDTPYVNILRSTDPGKRKYYLVDSKGNPRKLIYTFPIDNRTTTWYRTAKASKQQTWSPIFVYKVVPTLGIFAVTPIYNQTGKWQGVFASSFTLSAISTFLDRLDFSSSGRFFIMERSGKLVATSTQESLLVKPEKGEATQLLAVNSKDTRTRDIARQLTQKFGNFRTLQATQQLSLVSNHKRQFVRVTPYTDKYGLDWLIVTVVPESDFMEQIHGNTRTTIFLCIAALFGSIGIGIITARWITKPILCLNTAAKDIALGGWDKTVEINRADEVGELANSFNKMAAQLQTSFAELNSLNEALAQSERRFRTLFESTPKIPVQGYNRYRQVIFWNKASEELYGYTEDEALGKTLEELIIPHDIWEEVIPVIDAWIAGGSAFPPSEIELRRKDGSTVTVYSSHIMLTNAEGEPEMYCVDIDLSDRKQAERLLADYNRTLETQVAQRTAALQESERQLSTLVANLPGYVYRVANDPNYTPEFISEGVFSITGYQQDEYLIERTISCRQEIHPADVDSVWNIVQNAVEARQPYECEYRIITKTGTQKWVWERGQGIYAENGELRFLEGFVTDISDKKLAEAALQANQRRYQTLTEASPVFIFHADASGNCTYANQRMSELLGLSREESLNTGWANSLHPDDRDRIFAQWHETIAARQPFKSEYRFLRPDGKITWVLGQALPEVGNDGEVIGYVGTITDINERKQVEEALRESEQRYLAIIEDQTELIARFLPDGTLSFVNVAYCVETMFRSASEFVVDNYLQATKGGAYNQGVNYQVTQDIYQAGFSHCYIQLLEELQIRAYIIVPIFCGNQLWGLLASYQNSHPRTWSEAEINTVVQIGIQLGVALQQAQLLQETQQQAVQLEHAKDAAEAANLAKSQFLANMSHELRTPLNGILGYAQILQADKNCTPKQQKGVSIIHQCGTHLLILINDILDLSKIEAGKLELYPENFNLLSLLTSLSEIFQIKATQKSITFTYLPLSQLPKLIHADEKRLRQVLMNLLSNAVKFTDRGRVTFKVEVIGKMLADSLPLRYGELGIGNERQTINNKIRFQVEDTGIGIPAEHLEKIFLPFEQVGDSSRRAEGTGLGLAITQKIVQLMGGQLFVESTPGVGSKFWFDLDVSVASTPVPSIIVKSTDNIIGYSGAQRKILIVDDYWENLTVLLNMLEPIGFELEQAVDGQEGLEKAVEWQPDLILVDLVMPVMDGYQMTRQLRQLPEFQDTIIIAISANVFERDRLLSLQAGCNDFLPKPVRAEDLLDKIKHYLNLSWIYDSESNAPAQTLGDESSRYPQVEPKEMVIPPKEELLALYEATNIGHVNGVKEEALRLQQLNPDYNPFATRILELAAEFEYEEIVNLIDPYLS